MIPYYFMNLLHTLFAPLLSAWTALDPHLDQNPYLVAIVSYMSTMNNFLPLTDAMIPAALLWYAIASPVIGLQIVVKLYNAIRGAGVKLFG